MGPGCLGHVIRTKHVGRKRLDGLCVGPLPYGHGHVDDTVGCFGGIGHEHPILDAAPQPVHVTSS